MARTESISFQVHPADEQSQIDLMQQFHWNLLSTQEIKVVDSHLEKRGDTIYSVTKSDHYIKLAFSRELDLPNLEEIKRLEREYFGLQTPQYPKLFPVGIWLWGILALIYGIGIVGWMVYFFASYKPKKAQADAQMDTVTRKRREILNAVSRYGSTSSKATA